MNLTAWICETAANCWRTTENPLMPVVHTERSSQRTTYMMRSRKTGMWLRGAKYWTWTNHMRLAAGHSTPGVLEMLLEKHNDQDPEILRFATTVLVTRPGKEPPYNAALEDAELGLKFLIGELGRVERGCRGGLKVVCSSELRYDAVMELLKGRMDFAGHHVGVYIDW